MKVRHQLGKDACQRTGENTSACWSEPVKTTLVMDKIPTAPQVVQSTGATLARDFIRPALACSHRAGGSCLAKQCTTNLDAVPHGKHMHVSHPTLSTARPGDAATGPQNMSKSHISPQIPSAGTRSNVVSSLFEALSLGIP